MPAFRVKASGSGIIWTDPRNGKEWRVVFTWTGPCAPEPSDPIARFYHPVDPSTTRESLRADRRGDEDLDSMTDQELMDLLDKATQ